MQVPPLHTSHTTPTSVAAKELPLLSTRLLLLWQQAHMCCQYIVVQLSIWQHHWYWFHSSLIKSNQIASCQNIGLLSLLPQCVTSVRHPTPATTFPKLGHTQGLRLTHSLVDHPANGICLGTALRFLTHFATSSQKDHTAVMQAAQFVQGRADATSIRLQSIYDGLLGLQGSLNHQERAFFCKRLTDPTHNYPTKYPDLLQALTTFLQKTNPTEPLRKHLLESLESQQITITPDLYTLILEIDASWQVHKDKSSRKYQTLHRTVQQTVAQYAGLELSQANYIQGHKDKITNQIAALDNGLYLIQFSNHVLAYIKTDTVAAIFNSSEGVSVFPLEQLQPNIRQMVSFYSHHNMLSVDILGTAK